MRRRLVLEPLDRDFLSDRHFLKRCPVRPQRRTLRRGYAHHRCGVPSSFALAAKFLARVNKLLRGERRGDALSHGTPPSTSCYSYAPARTSPPARVPLRV